MGYPWPCRVWRDASSTCCRGGSGQQPHVGTQLRRTLVWQGHSVEALMLAVKWCVLRWHHADDTVPLQYRSLPASIPGALGAARAAEAGAAPRGRGGGAGPAPAGAAGRMTAAAAGPAAPAGGTPSAGGDGCRTLRAAAGFSMELSIAAPRPWYCKQNPTAPALSEFIVSRYPLRWWLNLGDSVAWECSATQNAGVSFDISTNVHQ